MLAWLAELLFPARCIGCGIRGVLLCQGCRAELPYLPSGLCPRCAARRGPRGACHGCRRLSPALSSVRAAFAYEGAARTAVLNLKFRSARYLAPVMGEFLRADLAQQPLHADVIVPVPLAKNRERQRGFNQALLAPEQIAPSVGGDLMPRALTRQDRT